jgi:hypothetical protein
VVIGFELSKPAVSEIQFQLMLERERAINPADADNRRQQKAIQARSAQAGSAAAILLRGIRFPSLDSRTLTLGGLKFHLQQSALWIQISV